MVPEYVPLFFSKDAQCVAPGAITRKALSQRNTLSGSRQGVSGAILVKILAETADLFLMMKVFESTGITALPVAIAQRNALPKHSK